MRLGEKVAVITGAGSGIGRASALLFAAEGAKVVVADINDRDGEETAVSIRSRAGEAVFVRTDVSVASEVENLIRVAVDSFGKIDILFNNVGIAQKGISVEDMDESRWDYTYAVNVKSIFLGVKYAVPEMKRSGGGVIINSASIGGVRPHPFQADYESAKGAVVLLTKALALELARSNIRVNCVIPGTTDTPLIRRTGPPGLTQEEDFKRRISYIPLGRMCKPEDIAYAALYLASDEASMVTGEGIHIDGGRAI